MCVSAALSKTAENLSGLYIIYRTTGLSHGLVNSLPYILEKFLITRENKLYSTIVFPSTVVLTEYVLSLILGIWGNPSIAQYNHITLIQAISVTGIFGISFMVAWLASVVNWIIKNEFKTNHIQKGLGVYGLVFFTVLLYGGIRINLFPPRSGTVKVGANVSDTDIDIPKYMSQTGKNRIDILLVPAFDWEEIFS